MIHLPFRIIKYFYYSHKFGQYFWSSIIDNPLRIDGGDNIFIGKSVSIKYKSWIAAKPLTGSDSCRLVFEEGCVIGHFNHIFATKSIILQKNVLTADKVYISDNLHGYDDIKVPILKQPIVQKKAVEIGEGTWLGENVCVIGANVGKHCIIGANSVVTRDIPDYSVAVGAPAKVIKKYDFHSHEWVKV